MTRIVTINIIFSKENLAFESFTPVIRYLFDKDTRRIQDYYEFARYLNPEFEKLVDSPKLSITSATQFKDRIRFTHFSKIYYVFNFLIESILNKSRKDSEYFEIHLLNCNEMIEYDVMFVDHFIERIKHGELPVTLKFDEHHPRLKNVSYVNENTIRNKVKFSPESFWVKDNKVKMFQRAMNLFLYEDAIRLGKELFHSTVDLNEKCVIADRIGIANVLYDRTDVGEDYYNYVLEQKCTPDIKVSVLYKLSMLYLRHHPSEKRDAQRGESYLIAASELIEENKEALGENYIFHKVFNRNGYSLVLYRKGDMETAHHYCIDGHEQILRHYGPIKHILHRSVLMYNSTLTAIGLEDYEQAFKQFDYLLDMDPYYPNYWSARAELHKKLGQFDKSIQDFSHAIELNPFSERLRCARGIVYETMGELEKATEDYVKALDLNPNHADSLMNYGVLLLNENNLDQALAVFVKLSRLNTSKKHEVYNNIGVVFLEKGQIERAIEGFQEALKFKSDFSTAIVNQAIAYFKQSKYQKALDQMNMALSLESHMDYLYNRAFLFNKMGQMEASLADINELLKQDPDHYDALELKKEIENNFEKSY
ncbi:tetratricopeptide repeat protein [Brevibacillus laterosporus]|uniref:tetratricopeptide repeat protein n=1 Tax=Brevibacillus laterosporus TaxID=1465 RepID=UPI0035A599A9